MARYLYNKKNIEHFRLLFTSSRIKIHLEWIHFHMSFMTFRISISCRKNKTLSKIISTKNNKIDEKPISIVVNSQFEIAFLRWHP